MKPIVALLAAFLILAPAAAHAERDATRAEWQRVESHLKGLGYRDITDVDIVGGNYVVDATSPQGHDVDVYIDRKTLRIVRERRS